MSFSSGVKDELSRHQTLARHCQIAEIAAIISMCGGVSISEKDHYSLKIQTENVYVARKYLTLLKKALAESRKFSEKKFPVTPIP